MSTIDDILKTERETAEQLRLAKEQAEKIKKDARTDAARIVSDARAKRAQERQKILEETRARIAQADEKTEKELENARAENTEVFSKKKEDVAKWIVTRILHTDTAE